MTTQCSLLRCAERGSGERVGHRTGSRRGPRALRALCAALRSARRQAALLPPAARQQVRVNAALLRVTAPVPPTRLPLSVRHAGTLATRFRLASGVEQQKFKFTVSTELETYTHGYKLSSYPQS